MKALLCLSAAATIAMGCARSASSVRIDRPAGVSWTPEILVRRPPSGSGPVDGDLIGRAIARRRGELAQCYRWAGGDAIGRGVVYVLLDLGSSGDVRGVTVGHTDVRDTGFESCLISVLGAIRAPRAERASLVQAYLVVGARSEDEARAMLVDYRAERNARPAAPVTVAGLRGRLQPCYERELRRRPGLRGRTVLQLTLDQNGTVADAAFSSDDGLDDGLGRCVLGMVRNLRLQRDDPSMVTLQYPVILEPGTR